MANPFQCNYAIICRIPDSFAQRSVGAENIPGGLNLQKAREEYDTIREVLKNCDVNLIELQEDENYPDCCFVEDCAVVIGGTALVTRPGHPSRTGEVGEIRRVLKQDMRLVVKEVGDAKATLDGGDVLFTGKEIFVGVGKRTNALGAKAVAEAFQDHTVSMVEIGKSDLLHLKDGFAMAGREIMAVSPGIDVAVILKKMQDVASYPYKVMQLDSREAADMLYINGRLIHHVRTEMGDTSYGKLDEKIPYTRHHVQMSELRKVGGTLSSLFIPINIQRAPKMFSSDITNADLGAYTTWTVLH
ncbi:N(G),N(G)-dimethylarginine dimethylaminohydrolase 1-like isoform X1 [Pomacea canaliculata]|uniref:N(G),N(G)-dimethylarginine dimethylaminohydrolase 1-like isoform X1 n=1 Tax=Pomacea canaliculata TaxID=400727 RepID=UPI000D739D2B|nr:N(G),N(G)-dimethylarginine dimethylaminohydrolase 1-like isoform X1 [Pomacea canaliculata]